MCTMEDLHKRIEPVSAKLHSQRGKLHALIMICEDANNYYPHKCGQWSTDAVCQRTCLRESTFALIMWPFRLTILDLNAPFLLYTVKTNSFFTWGFLWSAGAAVRSDDLQTTRFCSTVRSTCIASAAYQTFTHPRKPLKAGQIFSIQFKTLYAANTNENKLWEDFKCTDAV